MSKLTLRFLTLFLWVSVFTLLAIISGMVDHKGIVVFVTVVYVSVFCAQLIDEFENMD